MNRSRLFTRLIEHGATHVELARMVRESVIIWQITPIDEMSETCVHLEEFISSAARNCQSALRVTDRLQDSVDQRDPDFLTALKKYVEDAGQAIKEVDDTLGRNNASLASLLFEIPSETEEDKASWRNLIGRRDVIAHRLLTVDDEQVYKEAVRDFGSLRQLLSRIYFAPVKSDLASDAIPAPALRMEVMNSLIPATHGRTPRIGESLIFIYEDKREGLWPIRMGRTEGNKALIASPHNLPHFSLDGMSNEELLGVMQRKGETTQ